MKIIKGTLLIGLGFIITLFCVIFAVIWYIFNIPLSAIEEEALPNWSPNGKHLVYECYLDGPTSGGTERVRYYYTEEAADICTIGLDGSNPTHLTKNSGADRYPVWSPGSSQIAYVRHDGIYIINGDGTNKHQLVQLPPNRDGLIHMGKVVWSPDGTKLLFSGCLSEELARDIYLVDVATHALTNLTKDNNRQDIEPRWSSNGTKIVFLSASLLSDTCRQSDKGYYRLEIINNDGTGRKVIYDKESIQPFVSVTNEGQIAFVANLAGETFIERISGTPSFLYTFNLLNDPKPSERDLAYGSVSWAPNGILIAYSTTELKIFDVETGQIHELPSGQQFLIDSMTWSPDSQQVAVTASIDQDFYSEEHIYIFNLQDDTIRQLQR